MKEDIKMEDQILMLYYSAFSLVSGSVYPVYKLIAEIILRYSIQTVQVLSNNVGP